MRSIFRAYLNLVLQLSGVSQILDVVAECLKSRTTCHSARIVQLHNAYANLQYFARYQIMDVVPGTYRASIRNPETLFFFWIARCTMQFRKMIDRRIAPARLLPVYSFHCCIQPCKIIIRFFLKSKFRDLDLMPKKLAQNN